MKLNLLKKLFLIYLGLTISIFCKVISEKEINKLSKSNECDTPLDCFTRAIDALNLAKQTYYSAVDKIDAIQTSLISYIDDKVKNSNAELREFAEGIKNDLTSKINSVQEFSNAKYSEINNSVHNHSCREGYTGCNDDGSGNFVYADRHYVSCNDNEFMKSWQWIRCEGFKTIRVHYICCRNP